jgi:hypothetical protein
MVVVGAHFSTGSFRLFVWLLLLLLLPLPPPSAASSHYYGSNGVVWRRSNGSRLKLRIFGVSFSLPSSYAHLEVFFLVGF